MAGATMAPETLNPEAIEDEPEQAGGWFGQLTRRLLK
jgi:hypothetical protein